jgi:serine/threonine protein kinase
LKPENLFVTTTREGSPFVKILDFGVSKFATTSSGHLRTTRAGMVYGSPAYMSPEQLTAQADVDARTDVFALGVVLFQCLTGKLPFDGATVEALVVRVLSGEATPIETLRPGLPPGLVEVVRRALAASREERIPTARALAEALGPFRVWAIQLAHAATVASSAPVGAASGIPSALPRPPRTFLPLAATATVLAIVAITTLVLLAHSRAPAAVASPPPWLLPAASATSARTVVSASPPLPATIATLSDLTAPSSVSDRTGSARVTDSRKVPATPSPSVSAAARPSGAQSLGLSEDNPFR